jgi:hypothetical protein
MKRLVALAALAAVALVLKELFGLYQGRSRRLPRHETDSWENEGGALAPHAQGLETSQVPR